jgi:hypothetical protein
MNKIKVYLALLFLVATIQQSFGQTYKFRTSGYSVLQKNENRKWGKWSDLNLVNMVVTLDTDKNRIVVYSQSVQLFDILVYEPIEENETDIVYAFSCKDNDGKECVLSIITRKKQDNRKQLYITYKDKMIVYNIFNM